MSSVTVIPKTTRTYLRDLAERVLWTFVLAAVGVALAAGPGGMFTLSFWETVGTAGLIAVGSVLKGLAAKAIGDRNSASTAPGV